MSDEGTCPSCGYQNPLGSNFCSSCGHQLSQRGDVSTAAIDPTQADGLDVEELASLGEGMLIVRQGSKRGSRMALDTDRVTLGRHPESDIFLDDVTVSRRHAEVVRADGGHDVVDVGSLNGTYVNRERVERQRLAHGDELQVGKFKLVYVALGDASAEADA